jgi:hypothetical protein
MGSSLCRPTCALLSQVYNWDYILIHSEPVLKDYSHYFPLDSVGVSRDWFANDYVHHQTPRRRADDPALRYFRSTLTFTASLAARLSTSLAKMVTAQKARNSRMSEAARSAGRSPVLRHTTSPAAQSTRAAAAHANAVPPVMPQPTGEAPAFPAQC